MKVISKGDKLGKTIIKLINQHDYFAFAVAWASAGTDVFYLIQKVQKKLKMAAIGTHFYQTHPTVLESFIGSKKVRFVLQPQGVFHPKVYLFWSKERWDLLIGSANLTSGALTKNNELMLHLSSDDAGDSKLDNEVLNKISDYFKMGEVADNDLVEKYRALWAKQQPSLKRISGGYSSDASSKSPIHTEIMSMSWDDFYKSVKDDPFHGHEKRCDLLEMTHDAFRENNSFSNMAIGLRKTIAGLPNDFNEHAGWFGSMKGAGYYHQAINNNDGHISSALDFIPFDGAVTKEHYDSYISEFIRAFPDGRHGVGIASRLLALKRPDYFVCLDSKNKSNLCKDFGIKSTKMTYERYWEDLICRIHDSVWWNSRAPVSQSERRVWNGRAAMLDAIFYEE